MASLTSSRRAIDRAFFFSGRASVIVATPALPVTRMCSGMPSSMTARGDRGQSVPADLNHTLSV